MAKAGYVVSTPSAVALAAATAKTVVAVVAPASFGIDLVKLRVSFDGVTATAVPVLVELCSHTAATAGTSTAATPVQAYGRTVAHGTTAGVNYTVEPTVLTVVDQWLLSPNSGTVLYDWPLGTSPDSAVSQGFALRLTAPAVVNCRAALYFERC